MQKKKILSTIPRAESGHVRTNAFINVKLEEGPQALQLSSPLSGI